jgi:hypothetical protein
VRKGIDVRVEISRCSYLGKAFFAKYVGAVPTPAVKSNRRLLSCEKKPALLFCHGCRAHCSDEVLTKLAQNGVIMIADPLRILHVFQVLDVLLFGVLKPAKECQRKNDSLADNIDRVLRVFRAHEIAMTRATIRSSWLRTGFGYQARDGTTHLVVEEDRVRLPSGVLSRLLWQSNCVHRIGLIRAMRAR